MMDKQSVIAQLQECRDEMHRQFAVKAMAVFGSVARGEANEHSDVDILVDFEGRADFDRFMDLKFYLEDLLGSGIDLVTENALRPSMRRTIEKEMIYVT